MNFLKRGFGMGILALWLAVFGVGAQAQTRELLSFAIVGDAGDWTDSTKLVAKSIATGHIQNLILPGDNLYHPDKDSYADVWGPWVQMGFRFPIVAIGNHTLSYKDEVEYFKMPGEYFARSDGSVRFVILNSDNVDTAEEQAKFLEQQLAHATEPLLFLVYHHPSFTIGGHGWQEKEAFQSRVRPLLMKYQNRITGVIVGHDHMAALIQLGQSLPMIISGAAMEQLPTTPVNYVDSGVRVRTVWSYRGTPTWTRLDIDPASKVVWLNFVSAPQNEVTCSVRIAPRPFVARPNCAKSRFVPRY